MDYKIDKYELIEEISIKNDTHIFQGKNTENMQDVAIKIFSKKISNNIESMNYLKAQIANIDKLFHPYNIEIYSSGKSKSRIYYAMEFIHGETLSKSLKKHNEKEAIQIIWKLVTLLEHSAKFGVTHRYITADDIIIDQNGDPKLSINQLSNKDFQKQMNKNNVHLPAIINSEAYNYSSPESIIGDEIGEQHDIFCLGRIFYHMLTGHHFFKSNNLDTLLNITRPKKIDVRKINPSISTKTSQIVATMMQKNLHTRYPSFVSLLRDLNHLKSIKVDYIDVDKYCKAELSFDEMSNYQEIIKDCSEGKIDYYNRGYSYQKMTNYEEAIKDYNKIIETNPKNLNTYQNRAYCYSKLEKYTNAIDDYNNALILDSECLLDHDENYYCRARHHHELGENSQALENYNKTIEINPKYSNAYYYRGMLHNKSRAYQKAIADYTKAINLYQELSNSYPKTYYKNVLTFYNGKTNNESEYYLENIKLFDYEEGAYSSRALSYYKIGEYQNAINDYSHVITKKISNPIVYGMRGLCFYKIKKYSKAISDYSQAIQNGAQTTKNYTERGHCYYNIGKYKNALNDYSQVIEKTSLNIEIYIKRAHCYNQLEQYENAINDYTKIADENNKDQIFFEKRGFCYYKLCKYNKAIDDYTCAIEKNYKHTKNYYYRGLSYTKLKQCTKAIQDMNIVIKSNPKHPDAYFYKALNYSRSEQWVDAIDNYTLAIKKNYTSNAIAYNHQGFANYKLYEYTIAINNYNNAIKIDAQCAEFYFNRGIAHNLLENHQLAIDDYSKAIEVHIKDVKNLEKLDNSDDEDYEKVKKYYRSIRRELPFSDSDKKAFEKCNTYIQYYFNRALSFHNKKQHIKAINDYSKIIEIDQNNAESYFNRGLSYYKLGKHEHHQDYKKAIALNSQYSHSDFTKKTNCKHYKTRKPSEANTELIENTNTSDDYIRNDYISNKKYTKTNNDNISKKKYINTNSNPEEENISCFGICMFLFFLFILRSIASAL